MLTHAPVSLDRTYRLVTRSDFDGLVCAALLRELGLLDEILFVHPKDVQDGKVELSDGDITTNLPYRPEVALAFDHHSSERRRVVEDSANRLMMQLIDSCLELSIEAILDSPDVVERVELYRAHAEAAAEQIRRCSTVHGRLVVLDLRDEEIIHPTNRFLLYAIRPQCRVSIHVLWGLRRQNTVFAVGRSILDRSSQLDIGALMLARGGGGHQAAGTCQIDNEQAEAVLAELVETITRAEGEPHT